MPPSRPDDEPSFEKLDARLAAVTRLPSPTVADMLRRDKPVRKRGAKGGLSVGALHGIRTEKDGQAVASVLIRFHGSAERFVGMGARIFSVVGDVATAEVPLSALRALEADPEVVFIELTQPLIPLLDQSVPSIGAAALHVGNPVLRGKGIVVGIIDIDGIDIHHPDFSVAGSSPPRTRIQHLWDQTGRWPPRRGAGGCQPKLWPYGVEYTAEEIDRDAAGKVPHGIVVAQPTDKHGTHVAGIAAGNGRASEGKYTGVAPEADIVFVNLRSEDSVGSTSSLIDALEYVFARANGRPCVVNVSLGTRRGPRNGTSNVERAIDRIVSQPGRAVVVAAGNDGARGRDLHGTLPAAGAVAVVDFNVPPNTTQTESVEIWYPGTERLRVTVQTPRDNVIGPVAPGDHASCQVDRMIVTAISKGRDAASGDASVEIMIHPDENAAIAQGPWKITLEREGPAAAADSAYHATLTGASTITFTSSTKASTLLSPGTAAGAVTVANYIRQNHEKLCSSSSQGPTRDGRRKPDIAAPGSGVCSAKPVPAQRGPTRGRPVDLYYGTTSETTAPEATTVSKASVKRGGPPSAAENSYIPLTGTSMAAPHVAGLIALIYEREGAIAGERLKALLFEHADRTGLDPGWDPAYGWGRCRAPPGEHRTGSELLRDGKQSGQQESIMNNAVGENVKAKDEAKANGKSKKRGGLVAPLLRKAQKVGNTEQLEIDIGDFVLFDFDDNRIGEVFVTVDPEYPTDASRTVEHWCLYQEYEAPSDENTLVKVKFEYGGTYTTLQDWLDHLEELEDYRYIIAKCTEQST